MTAQLYEKERVIRLFDELDELIADLYLPRHPRNLKIAARRALYRTRVTVPRWKRTDWGFEGWVDFR